VKEDGRLCHPRLPQLFIRAGKHYVSYAETKKIVGLFKHVTRCGETLIEIFAHAGELRSLPREYECFHSCDKKWISGYS
jgi:hypothetical protein